MEIITIKNVSKTIKGRRVLQDINLSIEKGRTYGVVGHNGSGKTMLFRLILGLIKPTEGTITVDAQVSFGATIENPSFLGEYSGFQNLKLLANINQKITNEQICQTIAEVGLDPDSKEKVKSYSLGMKQKLALAQALMEKPSVLVLDEPTNGLDNDSVLQIRRLLKEEHKKGTTIIFTSHNVEDVKELAQEVLEMNDGVLTHSRMLE